MTRPGTSPQQYLTFRMARADQAFSRILLKPVALMVVLAFGLAALLGTLYGERATHYLVQQLVAQSTDGLRSHLQRFLEKPHLVSAVNADAMRFGEIDPEGLFRKPEEWFFRQHHQFPEIDDVYFGRRDGAIVGIDRTGGQLVLKITTRFPERSFFALDAFGRRWGEVASGSYDARQRDWYKLAVARGKPVWSDVYVLQNKPGLGITAAQPAYSPQGELVGVMGVNLTLASISDYLRQHPVAARASSYIVDRSGLLVASSSPLAMVAAPEDERPGRVAARAAPDTAVAESFRALLAQAAAEGPAVRPREALEISVAGVRHWVYAAPYTDPRGLDWQLVSVVDPEPFLTGVRRLAVATLVMGMVLLAALAVTVARVTRRLAQPLEQLSAVAGRIAEGHPGETVPQVAGGRELMRLVTVFNDMSVRLRAAQDRLAAHAEDLERQVAARTAELSASNAALAQARDQARAASDAKSRFLAGLSHEIRTPLGAVSGLAYLMRTEPASVGTPDQPDRPDPRLAQIEQAAAYLLQVVNAQLDLSAIEAGRLQLASQPLDMHALVQQVLDLQAAPARAKGLQLDADVGPMPPGLLGDATRLQQALLNYVANAVRMTERGGIRVTVQAAPPQAGAVRLQVEVHDTGPGLSPEQQARMFQPIATGQVNGLPSGGVTHGAGLGLAITRELVHHMGGEVGVRSTPGAGSTFSFSVRLAMADAPADTGARAADPPPLTPDPAADARALQALRERAAGARVLLVEDDTVSRLIVQAMLAQAGLVVDAAADAATALRLAQEHRHALLLLDLMLPDLDGLTLAMRLRQMPRHARTPIIAVTAQAFAEDRQRCLQAGMDDMLTKPLSPQVLFATLGRWLSGGAMSDDGSVG